MVTVISNIHILYVAKMSRWWDANPVFNIAFGNIYFKIFVLA